MVKKKFGLQSCFEEGSLDVDASLSAATHLRTIESNRSRKNAVAKRTMPTQHDWKKGEGNTEKK
jgi:hypothetical protein